MDRQQILNLYTWEQGICFQHPSKGTVPTAVVGVIHPREDGEKQVRGCEECVIALGEMRHQAEARTGSKPASESTCKGAE